MGWNKDTFVFVRVKDNDICVSMLKDHKTHEVVFNNGKSGVLKMTFDMYECHRNFLIKHSFLSCLSEIQLIKPKELTTYTNT